MRTLYLPAVSPLLRSMLRLKDQSLGLQLPLIAAAAAFLVSLCLLWLAATSGSYLLDEQEKRHGQALARQVAASVTEPLQRGDLLSARAMLQRFMDDSAATGVTISDIEGMPMGSAGDTIVTDQAFRAPIRIGEDIAGEALVTIADPTTRETRWRFLFSFIALAGALSLLVFLVTRVFARRLATALGHLNSELLLPDSETGELGNELTNLESSVRALPLDMLRGHASVPAASREFVRGTILFVHLASLARYVNTLNEKNLHRYSRRLQQILQAAAQCYRGELTVARPFGVLISFLPQPNAGSEALRAASCARLLGLVAEGLESRISLSLDLAMALDRCEHAVEGDEDMYPQLHLQGAVEELHERCLRQEDFPGTIVSPQVWEDEQLADDATLSNATADGERTLLALSEEQERLLEHQAAMIVERIMPGENRASGD